MEDIKLFSEKYIFVLVYLIIIILFIFSNLLIGVNSSKIIFNIFLITFIQIYIFILFGFDFVSCISLLTSISLVPSILVYYNLILYNKTTNNLGDLTLGVVPINLYKDTFYIIIFLIIWSISSYLLHINILEKGIYKFKMFKLNKVTIFANDIISILSAFIAFPSAPTFGSMIKETSFANALLPGHAWNQLAIVALLFNLQYLFKKKNVMFTYLLIIFWFVTHGERADISGLILGLVILIFLDKNISITKKITSLVFSITVSIYFISIKSGYNFTTSLKHFFTFTTINDTSYEINAAIDYIENFGFVHGKILLSTLESSIPFVHGSHDINYFLSKAYPIPGGSSIITDPLMDWGLIGLIIITTVYVCLIKMVLHGRSLIFRYESLILISSIPRLAWYGIYFVFTSMIFFVPFIYFLDKYLNSIKR